MTDTKTQAISGAVDDTRPVRRKLRELFGIDLRSLAAFRIAGGIALLLNLIYRCVDITAHYTDYGVLPRRARIDLFQFGVDQEGRYVWSLHMLSGEVWAQIIMLFIAVAAAVCMMVGYRTRMATVLSWLLFLSLNARNPMIVDGGDMLLEGMLFFAMFLPLGAVWSIDRRYHPASAPLPLLVVSCATVAALLQLCYMYWFSAIFKLAPTWSRDFTAIYYVLNVDMFATRLGVWLRDFPTVMAWLTCITFWLEWLGPALAFFPFWTGKLRTAMVLIFWGFHLSLIATIELGLFPWICMVGWVLFIPSGTWEWLAKRGIAPGLDGAWSILRRTGATGDVSAVKASDGARGERPWLRLSWPANIFVGIMLLLVTLINIRSLDYPNFDATVGEIRPEFLRGGVTSVWHSGQRLARVLGLEQEWKLFAPTPLDRHGWYEMEGTLLDGEKVNLWQPTEQLQKSPPELISASYLNQRWRKYLLCLSFPGSSKFKEPLKDWLCWRWKTEYGEGNPLREVAQAEITYHVHVTPPPGEPIKTEDVVIYTWIDPNMEWKRKKANEALGIFNQD